MSRALALLSIALLIACGSNDSASPFEYTVDGDHDTQSEHAEGDNDGEGAGHDDDTAAAEAGVNIYALTVPNLDGESVDLSTYEGGVSLVVNVASKCGYTRQYEGLQELHEEMSLLGVNVLGFPSNEFGGQEPGSAEEIRAFCTSNFGVTFPMFAKLETQDGTGQSELYAELGEATGELPGWNFCKYLIDKNGKPVAFFKSNVEPDSAELRSAIQELL